LIFKVGGMLVLLTFLSACSLARRPPPVRNYPAPDFTVNTAPFQEAGCPLDDSGRNVCPPDSPLARLGCDIIAAPGDYLGGLEPAYPINLCWKLGAGGQFLPPEQYIYRDGCLLPQYARYVIQQDEQFVLLETLEELKKAYAPITSADEALSYAMAATGLSAYFGFEAPPGFRYFVDRLEDSHVLQDEQGYKVYLYDYQLCGCGPHTSSYVEVLIKADGSVEESGRTPAFEDPEQDNLCID
jgi:hypothetical protein